MGGEGRILDLLESYATQGRIDTRKLDVKTNIPRPAKVMKALSQVRAVNWITLAGKTVSHSQESTAYKTYLLIGSGQR